MENFIRASMSQSFPNHFSIRCRKFSTDAQAAERKLKCELASCESELDALLDMVLDRQITQQEYVTKKEEFERNHSGANPETRNEDY